MAYLHIFAAIDKIGKTVKFPAYSWKHAELLASSRGYKDVGMLIREIPCKT